MNKKTQKQWVKNLRSGVFKQGTEALVSTDDKGNKRFCCLGVLLQDLDTVRYDEVFDRFSYKTKSHGRVELDAEELDEKLLKRLGMSFSMQQKLVNMNDDEHKSFKKIAKFIDGRDLTEDVA